MPATRRPTTKRTKPSTAAPLEAGDTRRAPAPVAAAPARPLYINVPEIRSATHHVRRKLARLLVQFAHSWSLSDDAEQHARATADIRAEERENYGRLVADALDALEVVEVELDDARTAAP